MGIHNSSETRVRPIFNALLDKDPTGRFLSGLWSFASQADAVPPPPDCGHLNAPPPNARMGVVFERVLPPPIAFLRWLIEHPERLQIPDENFGASSERHIAKRRDLFSEDAHRRGAAMADARRQLDEHGAWNSRHQWWALEGFTHVDCCLESDKVVLFVEGKRDEAVSPATSWFRQRSQLWRNLEVAQGFARGREFAVILAVETHEAGRQAMQDAAAALEGSYPHLSPDQRTELSRRLLGFVTWPQVVEQFALGAVL